MRLKQLTIGSQVKAALALAVGTSGAIFMVLMLLNLGGAPIGGRPEEGAPFVIVVLTLILTSGGLAAIIAILQIAGIFLLHLLPWRGPELKVEDPEPAHLAGIFE